MCLALLVLLAAQAVLLEAPKEAISTGGGFSDVVLEGGPIVARNKSLVETQSFYSQDVLPPEKGHVLEARMKC